MVHRMPNAHRDLQAFRPSLKRSSWRLRPRCIQYFVAAGTDHTLVGHICLPGCDCQNSCHSLEHFGRSGRIMCTYPALENCCYVDARSQFVQLQAPGRMNVLRQVVALLRACICHASYYDTRRIASAPAPLHPCRGNHLTSSMYVVGRTRRIGWIQPTVVQSGNITRKCVLCSFLSTGGSQCGA